jgi:glucokinase
MTHDTDVTRNTGTLALHIGGSKFSAGVVSASGGILLRDRVPTPGRDPWIVISGLVKRICAAADDIDIDGCGVSISGPVNVRKGTAAPLNISTWKDFPLANSVAELTGKPTVIDNEAKALARGEAWVGAAVDVPDFLAVYIGSSVSAGLVSGSRILEGNFGNAGFLGHMVVDPKGRECRCGARGCLEAHVSARAIEAETGHPPAYAPHALIERNAVMVGRVIASALAVLDVPKVLIGGSVVGTWGEPFVKAVEGEIRARARLDFTREVEVVEASLGSYGVLVGAAALVRHRMGGES